MLSGERFARQAARGSLEAERGMCATQRGARVPINEGIECQAERGLHAKHLGKDWAKKLRGWLGGANQPRVLVVPSKRRFSWRKAETGLGAQRRGVWVPSGERVGCPAARGLGAQWRGVG